MTDFLGMIKKRVLLFDGGLGTMLQQRGLPMGEAPERWNLENPETVVNVHQEYLQAGAEIVTTNSFGSHPRKLMHTGLSDRAYEVSKKAAEIARQAVAQGALVAGSIGSTGVLLMMGDVDPAELANGFEIQAQALYDGGVDLFIIETMSDLDEVELAVKAIRRACTLPVIVSMTFQSGKSGFRTLMGTDIEAVVHRAQQLGVDVIGTNCGAGIEQITDIVAAMRSLTYLPIIAEPNAGLPRLVNGRTVYQETPEMMAEKLPGLLKAGASVVGGCCGTTPAYIRNFRQVLDGLQGLDQPRVTRL